jgi:hypothetical protein
MQQDILLYHAILTLGSTGIEFSYAKMVHFYWLNEKSAAMHACSNITMLTLVNQF